MRGTAPQANKAVGVCRAGLWAEAHTAREALLGYLTAASGVGTLLDTRRARDYDPDLAVDRYLNQPAVQARAARTAQIMFMLRVVDLSLDPVSLTACTRQIKMWRALCFCALQSCVPLSALGAVPPIASKSSCRAWLQGWRHPARILPGNRRVQSQDHASRHVKQLFACMPSR